MGFQLSLQGVSKPKKKSKTIKFDSTPVQTKISLDSYDGPASTPPKITITPTHRITSILSAKGEREMKIKQTICDIEDGDILPDGLIINIDDPDIQDDEEDDYEKVPVLEFGAAMLRGMGYKKTKEEDSREPYLGQKAVRGRVLGIGAEAVDEDLHEELMGRGELKVPLIIKKRGENRVTDPDSNDD